MRSTGAPDVRTVPSPRRLSAAGVTHVLIVRSTLERRLDPKFPTQLQYHIVEVT